MKPPLQRISRLGKDLLDVAAVPKAEVERLLTVAQSLKTKQRRGITHPLLKGKTLGLLFQKPSTRTRVSFEAGMHQLGGHALVLPLADIQLSRGETVADTARVRDEISACMRSSLEVVAVAGAQRLAAAGTTRGSGFWMQGSKNFWGHVRRV